MVLGFGYFFGSWRTLARYLAVVRGGWLSARHPPGPWPLGVDSRLQLETPAQKERGAHDENAPWEYSPAKRRRYHVSCVFSSYGYSRAYKYKYTRCTRAQYGDSQLSLCCLLLVLCFCALFYYRDSGGFLWL